MLLLVAGIAILAHLFKPADWPPLAIEILHSLHGPGFAGLALLILWYLNSKCHSVINYFIAGSIAMAIGLLSEIAQIPGTRDAQVMDLAIDALGIFGALGGTAAFDSRVRRSFSKLQRLALPTLAGIALGIACIPTLWYGYALLEQKRAFPKLLTFDHSWEQAAFGQLDGERPGVIDSPDNWGGSGKVARAEEKGRFGIFLSLHPLPDWRDYSRLSFTLAAHKSEFPAAVCVRDIRPKNDPYRNRYCVRIPVTTEPVDYSITFVDVQTASHVRPFDFSKVDAIVFSAAKPGGANILTIDNVRLEN